MGTERGQVLLEAHKIINGDRQQSYGNPEDTHQIIADLWNGYLDGLARTYEGDGIGTMCYPRLENTDVAHMMVLFKIARQINGAGKRDSVVDACGYMALSLSTHRISSSSSSSCSGIVRPFNAAISVALFQR